MELNINPELKELIPKLQQEEYNLLEKSILKEGCRDSLITWNNTIIDGHNRYEICKRNDIPFNAEEMEFENIGQVKEWMIKNQLARRNLTDSQRRYFIGKRYEEEKKTINEFKGNQYTKSGSGNSCQHQTSKMIAEESNISERTVRNNADYSKSIDDIKKENPVIAEKLLNEEIKLTNKDVIEISETEPEEKKEILEKIDKGFSYKEIKESKKPHVSNNSGNNEWYTPTKFLEIARKVMGSIDIDPATSEVANQAEISESYYSMIESGNRGVPVTTAKSIAKALDFNWTRFYEEEEGN